MDTDEKKTTHIYLRCTEAMKRELLAIARKNERTLSGQCVFYLKQAMEKERSGTG